MALADKPEMVTLCHAAGRDDTTQFVTLTIPHTAAFGQAGHFNEDGTPAAGHENDYLGPCESDTTTTSSTTSSTTSTSSPTTSTTLVACIDDFENGQGTCNPPESSQPPGGCPPGYQFVLDSCVPITYFTTTTTTTEPFTPPTTEEPGPDWCNLFDGNILMPGDYVIDNGQAPFVGATRYHAVPCKGVSAVPGGDPTLPATGSSSTWLAVIAGLLLASGTGFVVASTRYDR